MSKRVAFLKSKKDWKIIDKEIAKLNGSKGFNKFMTSRLQMLKADFENNPKEVIDLINDIKTKKEHRQYYIPSYKDFSFLGEIQKATDSPISAIVDTVILSPLLRR